MGWINDVAGWIEPIAKIIAPVATLASLVTAFLAFRIYREARRIRELEWKEKSTSMWNRFNEAMGKPDNVKKWNAFLDGTACPKYEYKNEENWLIFSFLNILTASYHAASVNRLSPDFFFESLSDQFSRLYPRRVYVKALLLDCGYDSKFAEIFDLYCARADGLLANARPEDRDGLLAELKGSRWYVSKGQRFRWPRAWPA